MTVGRNDRCSCGSGRKYKKCHGRPGGPLADFFARPDLSPGCYDHPDFVAVEKTNPAVLELYAQHVLSRKRSEEKDHRTRRVVDTLTAHLTTHAREDELRGMCANVSNLLARMLDALGVWSFVVRGSVLLEFDRETGVDDTRHFWMQDGPGHLWLVAPPYKIVDCTLRAQHWGAGEEAHLPSRLIADETSAGRFSMKLYSPDDRMLPTQAHRDLWRWLPLQQVRAGRAMTTYCPGAISAPLEPLGDWKMSIGGVPLPE